MKIILNWRDPNFGETQHKVYRDTVTINPQSPPTEIATLGANVTSYEDTAVVSGTTYHYRVASYMPGTNEWLFSDELVIEAVASYPTTGLIADYDFSALLSNNVPDKTANANDLTTVNASLGTKGGLSDVMVLTGNGYAMNETITSPYTCKCLAILVYLDDGINTSTRRTIADLVTTGLQAYFDKGDNTGYATSESLTVGTRETPSGSYGRTYIRASYSAQWFRMIFNWNETNEEWDIYVNGVQDTKYTGTQTKAHLIDFAEIIRFGALYSGAAYVEGAYKDAKLYDRSLSSLEITELDNFFSGLVP